jgi:hypothetical protein
MNSVDIAKDGSSKLRMMGNIADLKKNQTPEKIIGGSVSDLNVRRFV